MLHDRDKRAGVPGPAVGLVELRHHPARDVVLPGEAENPLFKRTEPAGAERVPPAPACEVQDIEVREGKVCPDAVAGEPVTDVRDVERPAVEGDEGRPLRLQVGQDGGERRLLFPDRPREVLADADRPAAHPAEADEEDRS